MMRAASFLLVFGLTTLAPAGFAQEEKTAEEKEGFAERHELALRWANFAVLAVGLGYLVGKNAGPFFAARSRRIRKDMIEAADARKEAEGRAAEVGRRLANLEAEIAALRQESQREAQSETERIARQTAAELAKIQAHVEQEIASAGKAARMELKRYTGRLAVELAERKIRARMTPAAQNSLVEGFVADLRRSSPPTS